MLKETGPMQEAWPSKCGIWLGYGAALLLRRQLEEGVVRLVCPISIGVWTGVTGGVDAIDDDRGGVDRDCAVLS